MNEKPYKDPGWLREYYVKRRMSLKDIKELLELKYNCRVSIQTLYNWCESYDLLQLRGKGRNLKGKSKQGASRKKTPMQLRIAQMKRDQGQKRKTQNMAAKKRSR